MNGFPSTIKLSALRGTYSRVVARVSLKVNADLPRKKKRFTEIRDYTAVVPSYRISSSGFVTVRWILKTYIVLVQRCDASANAKDVHSFMQFLPCVCIVPVYTCEGQTNA